jgi:hypothetical protein
LAAAATAREERDERERAADARWQQVSQGHQLARGAARDAVIARHDAMVRAAEERLEVARAQVESARELLLGPAPATTPATSVPSRENDTFSHDPARVA